MLSSRPGLIRRGALITLMVTTAVLATDAPSVSAASATAVSAGVFHTCALTEAGGAKCWGSNFSGEVGDGTTTGRLSPVDVVGLTSGVALVSAEGHSCALTTSGGVMCWGLNSFGKLGDGTTVNRSTPADVVGLTIGAASVSVGGAHTCALTTSGGVKCWGHNAQGQLGDGTTTGFISVTPVDVVGLTSGVTAISAGETYTCALTTSGGVMCWGRNATGQLGDGTTTDRDTPVDVTGFLGALTLIPGVSRWGLLALAALMAALLLRQRRRAVAR